MISSPVKQRLKAGDMIAGRFRIVEEIGSGGFSIVYRAHQASMNRFVALKVLKSTASADEKTVERFRREALFASHLTHPNTIRLFDYGSTGDGMCFIAMELLEGQDLADVVGLGRPMALHRVWSILTQCCRSLAEAHQLGLVHRDLKPENIFLVEQADGTEFVKVLDFGVSKALGNFANASTGFMAPLTQKGTVFGTPLYMAPEQAMDQQIAASVDVYALGHIAFEMITGRAAFSDEQTAMDVMLRQINDPPLKLPPPLDQTPFSPLITKCTLKDPSKRIEDTARLLEHLLHDAFLPYMSAEAGARRTQLLSRAPTLEGVVGLVDLPQPPAAPAPGAPRGRDGLYEESQPASVEIFSDLDPAHSAPSDTRDAADIAFDTVLGFLAELGDSVPVDLWTLARARVIPSRYMPLADFVVDQAERYGIVERGTLESAPANRPVDSIWFTKPGFVAKLRAEFDTWVDPVKTHRDIATLLLDYTPSPRGATLRRVVEHLCRAEQSDQAMRLLWTSATRASANAKFREALDCYLHLLRLIDDANIDAPALADAQLGFEPAQVWIQCGETHAALGEYGAAQDAIRRGIAPALDTNPALRGRAFKLLGDLAVSQRQYDAARTHYRHARDSFREAKHPEAFVAAIGAMGHCALMDRKFSEAIELLSLAVDRAERLGNALLGARLGRFMSRALMHTADFRPALEHLRAAFEVFEGKASAQEIAETLVELGEASFAAGEFEASIRYYRRALKLDKAHHAIFKKRSAHHLKDTDPGNPADYSEFAYTEPPEIGLGHALAAQGWLEEATDSYEQALAKSLAFGNRLQQARVRFYLGDVRLALKDYSPAVGHFEGVQQIAQMIGQTELWVDACIRLAYLSFDAGEPAAAYTRLGDAMAWARSEDDLGAELMVRAHIIYLQLLEHEFRARAAAFSSLIAQSTAQKLRRAQVLCQYFNADVHAARGKTAEAKALLAQVRLGAAELQDYALLLPLSRRERSLIPGEVTAPTAPAVDFDPRATLPAQNTRQGVAIGAMVPPMTDIRRFFDKK